VCVTGVAERAGKLIENRKKINGMEDMRETRPGINTEVNVSRRKKLGERMSLMTKLSTEAMCTREGGEGSIGLGRRKKRRAGSYRGPLMRRLGVELKKRQTRRKTRPR